jgi:outer membrane immunogenic protein
MLRIRNLVAGVGASALAIAAGVGAANAADLSTPYTPPPASSPVYSPAPAWSWTGPYAGLVGGYGWATPGSGFEGGAYLGYNVQTNQHLVLGIEGDVMAAGKKGSNSTYDVDNNWDATLRGRVGYAWDKFMIYGTGGVAVGGLKSTTPVSESSTKTGWTAGLGIEAALTNNVTTRLEYRHTDLGTFPSGGGNYSSNDLLVGVGFKF